MTPTQKAKKLVWKYYHILEHTISNEYSKHAWEIAKQCALIAVNEIMNITHFDKYSDEEHQNYWQQVKTEIEKL
jgi:hypothetical protein